MPAGCDRPYTESVGSPPISLNILLISQEGGSQHSPRDTDTVRPCCVVEPSPGGPLVTARVHGALSAVPRNRYLGEYTPVCMYLRY